MHRKRSDSLLQHLLYWFCSSFQLPVQRMSVCHLITADVLILLVHKLFWLCISTWCRFCFDEFELKLYSTQTFLGLELFTWIVLSPSGLLKVCFDCASYFSVSTVRLPDTPAVSGQLSPHGRVSQQHPLASAALVTAEQVQGLPERGPPTRL